MTSLYTDICTFIGLPLHEIKHPAITICSQGLDQKNLDEAIKRQFEQFTLKIKNKNLTGLNYRIKKSSTSANGIFDASSMWKEYVKTYYPGSEIDSIKDFRKVAKITEPYTENKEFYKNLKTNQKSNFYYCKNAS